MRHSILCLALACGVLVHTDSFAESKIKVTRGKAAAISVTLKKLKTAVGKESKRAIKKKSLFLRQRERATVGGVHFPTSPIEADIPDTDSDDGGDIIIPGLCQVGRPSSGATPWHSIYVAAFDSKGARRSYDDVWSEAQRQKNNVCWSLYNTAYNNAVNACQEQKCEFYLEGQGGCDFSPLASFNGTEYGFAVHATTEGTCSNPGA